MHVNPKRHNSGSGIRRDAQGRQESRTPRADSLKRRVLGRQGGASSLFEALVWARPVRRSLGVGGKANSEKRNLG
jgi:hypothetical protein